MKNIFTFKKTLATAAMTVFGTLVSFAQLPYNNVWLRADVAPANSGLVFVDNYHTPKEFKYAERSEFKFSDCMTPGAAYIWVQPAEGWLYAGVARDFNKNGAFDSEDKQLHIWANNYFDALYDPTEYFVSGSSSQGEILAKEALEKMEKPTDQVFAVFTKGAVAYRAVGQEAFGKVYSDKLNNEPGDEVTFSAYGDSHYSDASGLNYYKFANWTDVGGNVVGTERELTVKVKGMEIYYANFELTTEEEFRATEKNDPHAFDWSKWNNPGGDDDDPWAWLGVESLQSAGQAANRIYDLQGRRVAAPVKGLYIVNGKKVVVK